LVNIVLSPTQKNNLIPEKAEFEITKDKIKLLTKEPIAGIQIELNGNFERENLIFQNGWESHFQNGRLIILNMQGSQIKNPETIFKFSGELKISNILVVDWNEKLIHAEINSQISQFNVGMAYPNPFNSKVRIDYGIKTDGKIEISVFNIRGKFIETILDKSLAKGNYEINWHPNGLPSGVYLIKFISNNEVHYRQVVYLK